MKIKMTWAALLVFAHAFVSAEPGEEDSIRLEAGSVQAIPGTKVELPLMLYLEEGAPPLGKIRAALCFAADLAKFVRAEAGPAGRNAQAELSSQVGPAEKQDCTPLRLQAVFKKPPASGTLANLTFEIDAAAPLNQTTELRATSAEAWDGSGAKIPVSASGGKIEVVETPPLFACFFYMH